jgi:serine/threonine-protein kinase
VTIEPGTVLAGKFIVERVLGEGGMGTVVAAIHAELGHRVAIKMMLPEAKGHPEMLARFEREARAAARLSSEHAARVTDVGRFDDGLPFMVMEFLEGEDLESTIARQKRLPIADVLRYFIQACIGLGDAHSHGIVHRDVKPSNLFLAQRPGGRLVLKVLDFGIAKANLSSTSPVLTRTSAQMGSPQYMSPEQLNDSKNVDLRTDVWSLGASMYEAVTGVPAFPATTLAALHVKIITENPVPPSRFRPDVPPELEAILLRCLEKDPERRFESLDRVQAELERLQIKISTSSGAVGAIPSEGASLPPAARATDGFAKTSAGTDPGVAYSFAASADAPSPFTGTEAPTSNTFGGIHPVKVAARRAPLAVVGSAVLAAVVALVAWRGASTGRPVVAGESTSVPVSEARVAAPPFVDPPVNASAVVAEPGRERPALVPVRDARVDEPLAAAVGSSPRAEAKAARRSPAKAAPTSPGAAEPAKAPAAKKRRSSVLDPELEE